MREPRRRLGLQGAGGGLPGWGVAAPEVVRLRSAAACSAAWSRFTQSFQESTTCLAAAATVASSDFASFLICAPRRALRQKAIF